MLILISPAKKLDFETTAITDDFTNPLFLKKSEALINELRKCKPAQISKLMKLSDSLTSLNVERYKNFTTPFTLKNSKQAIFSFKGDTYVGLDAETMSNSNLKYAQKNLRILSGLYGIISPLDLIQPYRLEMGTKFAYKDKKNLYEYWKQEITNYLNQQLNKRKQKIIINLASKEYFGAVDLKGLKAEVITPIFKEYKNDQYKIVSFYAKKARGMMSRYIIDNKITDPSELESFNVEGYKYNKKLSTRNEPVFTRKQ